MGATSYLWHCFVDGMHYAHSEAVSSVGLVYLYSVGSLVSLRDLRLSLTGTDMLGVCKSGNMQHRGDSLKKGGWLAASLFVWKSVF